MWAGKGKVPNKTKQHLTSTEDLTIEFPERQAVEIINALL